MPCELLELLCTVQPTALKSVVPLKLIAPLTVLFSARTQAGGPGVARAARIGPPPPSAGLASGSSRSSSRPLGVTTTFLPTIVAETDEPRSRLP